MEHSLVTENDSYMMFFRIIYDNVKKIKKTGKTKMKSKFSNLNSKLHEK